MVAGGVGAKGCKNDGRLFVSCRHSSGHSRGAHRQACSHDAHPVPPSPGGTHARSHLRRHIHAHTYRCTIHVIDTDPTSLSAGGWLEDVSKVEKYVMSDEDYARRENSYR